MQPICVLRWASCGLKRSAAGWQDLEAVQLCLPLLAEKSQKLAANGQARPDSSGRIRSKKCMPIFPRLGVFGWLRPCG